MPEKDTQSSLEYCLDQIKKLNDEMSPFQNECVEALKYFNSDPSIVKSSKKRSQATTTDFRDAVEWIRPSLLDIFTSTAEVVKLTPTSIEDVSNVKLMNKLVNYQLKVRNKWFELVSDFINDSAMFRVGAIKYQWYVDVRHVKKKYLGVTEIELSAIRQNPEVEILEQELAQPSMANPNEITYNITVNHSVKDAYPLIESIPLDEIGFKPTLKSTKNAFIWHRISYCEYDFTAKYGAKKFSEVKQTIDKINDGAQEFTNELIKDLGEAFLYDKKDNEYYVYECYYRDPKTGVATITEICGDIELNTYENKYGEPNFILAAIFRRAHRLVGSSQYELNKEYQKIRTAMLRQILDNLYFCNNRRHFVNPGRVDMNDYLNKNEPGAAIKTLRDSNPRDVAAPEEKAPIPPEIFAFWETMLVEKDYHTGIPRSFQGVTPDVLNKTFRGQAQQIEQASQRMAEAARNIAELVVAPLVEKIIDLNIKFLDKEISFRYLNEDIVINPDNLVGRYDITISVGTGTGDKDRIIMYLQQLLGLFVQVVKAGVPIVNGQDLFNVFKDIIQEMGLKNYNDYITDPKINAAVMQLVKLVIASGAPQQHPEIQPLLNHLVGAFGMNMPQNGVGVEGDNPPQPAQPINPPTPMQGEYFG